MKTLASLRGIVFNNLSPPVTFYIILFRSNCVKYKIQFPAVFICLFVLNLPLEVASESLMSI